MSKQKTIHYGVIPAEQLKLISGEELLRRILSGEFPAAPISRVFGFELEEVERGRVVFRGEPTEDHYNPIGSVHGGYAATLLDSCMGCAVHTMLPVGTGYTTLEIKVNYVRALSSNSGRITAEGKVIHVGQRTATAEGRILDAAGKLYAHSTTTCLVFPR